MKKFLAWLMAFFVALFNNVDYTKQDEHEYNAEYIYYLDCEDGMPDYRAQKILANANSASVSCRSANYSGGGKKVTFTGNKPSIIPYWFEAGGIDINSISDSEKTMTITSTGAIIAPYDCILTTENLKANDCTTMEVVCVIHNEQKYRISISGMSMWYCDRYRAELVYHTWDNPDGNGKRHEFKAGDVLGYSSGDTTITVNAMSGGSVTNDAITLRGFFMQQ